MGTATGIGRSCHHSTDMKFVNKKFVKEKFATYLNLCKQRSVLYTSMKRCIAYLVYVDKFEKNAYTTYYYLHSFNFNDIYNETMWHGITNEWMNEWI